MPLTIKAKENCRYDLVALGEIMLRFDPRDRRVATARSFDVYEGGGEYNVARGLKRCFGLDTAVVTAFADNPVGRLLQDLIYQGGVDQKYVRWVEYDGVGRAVRNGLNFTERGFGVRGGGGLFGPRSHGSLAAQAGRYRLGRGVRPRRRALVPHRRDFLRPFGNHPGGRFGSHGGGAPARHDGVLRSQLPGVVVEGGGRQEAARRR